MRIRDGIALGSSRTEQETLEMATRFLPTVDVFEPLSTGDSQQLCERLSHICLKAGEIFYAPDDYSEKLYILCKGRVRVYKTSNGREFTLAVLDSGTVFGEMTFTARRQQRAYAEAVQPSEIAVVSRKDFEHLIMNKPEVGLQMMSLLSERLRCYETRLEDVALKSVPARLASLILLLLESEGIVAGKNLLKIPTHYTHRQLGTMIGANRAAVTKAFAKLQDQGIIELKRRLIHVVDLRLLRRAAMDRVY